MSRPDPQRAVSIQQPPDPTPILNIGAGVGAAVVVLDDPAPEREMWACRRNDPAHPFHTGVHRRHVGGFAKWVALFPELEEGDYWLLSADGREHRPFSVAGGRVTTVEIGADPTR